MRQHVPSSLLKSSSTYLCKDQRKVRRLECGYSASLLCQWPTRSLARGNRICWWTGQAQHFQHADLWRRWIPLFRHDYREWHWWLVDRCRAVSGTRVHAWMACWVEAIRFKIAVDPTIGTCGQECYLLITLSCYISQERIYIIFCQTNDRTSKSHYLWLSPPALIEGVV